jgi:hypothetical protein
MHKPIPKIPHAREAYTVGRTLHVVTDLMHNSDSPGFDRVAHEEMMAVIRRSTEQEDHDDRYANFVVHSPDQPSYAR